MKKFFCKRRLALFLWGMQISIGGAEDHLEAPSSSNISFQNFKSPNLECGKLPQSDVLEASFDKSLNVKGNVTAVLGETVPPLFFLRALPLFLHFGGNDIKVNGKIRFSNFEKSKSKSSYNYPKKIEIEVDLGGKYIKTGLGEVDFIGRLRNEALNAGRDYIPTEDKNRAEWFKRTTKRLEHDVISDFKKQNQLGQIDQAFIEYKKIAANLFSLPVDNIDELAWLQERRDPGFTKAMNELVASLLERMKQLVDQDIAKHPAEAEFAKNMLSFLNFYADMKDGKRLLTSLLLNPEKLNAFFPPGTFVDKDQSFLNGIKEFREQKVEAFRKIAEERRQAAIADLNSRVSAANTREEKLDVIVAEHLRTNPHSYYNSQSKSFEEKPSLEQILSDKLDFLDFGEHQEVGSNRLFPTHGDPSLTDVLRGVQNQLTEVERQQVRQVQDIASMRGAQQLQQNTAGPVLWVKDKIKLTMELKDNGQLQLSNLSENIRLFQIKNSIAGQIPTDKEAFSKGQYLDPIEFQQAKDLYTQYRLAHNIDKKTPEDIVNHIENNLSFDRSLPGPGKVKGDIAGFSKGEATMMLLARQMGAAVDDVSKQELLNENKNHSLEKGTVELETRDTQKGRSPQWKDILNWYRFSQNCPNAYSSETLCLDLVSRCIESYSEFQDIVKCSLGNEYYQKLMGNPRPPVMPPCIDVGVQRVITLIDKALHGPGQTEAVSSQEAENSGSQPPGLATSIYRRTDINK